MELQIPTVKIDAEMKAPTNTAQIQTVHSNYDESVMATESLAALVGVANDFKVSHDAAIANEARLEISTLNATELADFQVNNNNPQDGDLNKAKESLAAKQQKILDKYGVDDLDLRVRNRFNADLKTDNAQFESSVASSIIEKRYKADMRLIDTQISSNINEAQMYYNDPKAVEKSTRLALEAMEVKGKMEGWTDEEFEFKRLKIHSSVQLTVGLTAAKKGNFALVEQIVNGQHKNMIDEDWRKLASIWKTHQAEMAVKKANIDPVLSFSLALEKRMSVYTDDYIQSEADKRGFTFDQMKMVLRNKNANELHEEIQQRNHESKVAYQPVAEATKLFELFKDHPSVKQAVTMDDKLIALFGVVNGVPDLAQQEHPDLKKEAVKNAMSSFHNVTNYKGYEKLLEEAVYGNVVLDNDAHQTELLKNFRANIDSFVDFDNESLTAKFRGEMGASIRTLNTMIEELSTHKAKKLSAEDKKNADALLNFYLGSNDTGTFNHSKGDYSLIIPESMKKPMEKKTVPTSKVNNFANATFKKMVFSTLMQKLKTDNLAPVITALKHGSDLIMDKDGNLQPEILECVKLTKERTALEFGFTTDKTTPNMSLKPDEMTYAERKFYNY